MIFPIVSTVGFFINQNYLIYLTVLLLTATSLIAQQIKLKDAIVYSGDTPAFSFTKKSMNNELYVYKLNTKEE
jgi:hypothetical protein